MYTWLSAIIFYLPFGRSFSFLFLCRRWPFAHREMWVSKRTSANSYAFLPVVSVHFFLSAWFCNHNSRLRLNCQLIAIAESFFDVSFFINSSSFLFSFQIECNTQIIILYNILFAYVCHEFSVSFVLNHEMKELSCGISA